MGLPVLLRISGQLLKHGVRKIITRVDILYQQVALHRMGTARAVQNPEHPIQAHPITKGRHRVILRTSHPSNRLLTSKINRTGMVSQLLIVITTRQVIPPIGKLVIIATGQLQPGIRVNMVGTRTNQYMIY